MSDRLTTAGARAAAGVALALALSLSAAKCDSESVDAAPSPRPEADLSKPEQRAVYALGLAVLRDLGPIELSNEELELVMTAMRDEIEGRPKLALDPQTETEIRTLQLSRYSERMERNEAFVEQAAAEKGAVTLESGAVFIELEPGKGESPTLQDSVRVSFSGRFADGERFAGSGGTPQIFPLTKVIPCWQQGLVRMRAGGKARLVCPPETAYGAGVQLGLDGDGEGTTRFRSGSDALEFQVELLTFRATASATPEPAPESHDGVK